MNNNIFIIHGHDGLLMYELKDFLNSLGTNPIILFQQDDRGLAIIEKFEYYASKCNFAFALLTPDDKQANQLTKQDIWRARQNVILEMGWFMHKLGRAKVILVHKGEVEIPSDLSGVLYLPIKNSIFEVSEKIRTRLTNEGLI